MPGEKEDWAKGKQLCVPGTTSSGVSDLWVCRLSGHDSFSPFFFSEVHPLLPHILTAATCCRQHSLALSALDKFPRTWTSGGSFSHWGMRRQGSFSNDHKPMLLMDSTLFPGTHYCLPPVSESPFYTQCGPADK